MAITPYFSPTSPSTPNTILPRSVNIINPSFSPISPRRYRQTGNKNDLILRIVEDDNNKRKSDGTLDELNILRMQSLNDDEDTLSDNSQLLTEIESLRKQVELFSNSSKQSPLPIPPPSQIDPNIAAILSTIMETQKQFLERQEVERISTLANWSDELKLTKAISLLSGSAKNWQLTTGQ
ncbi:hypothetical protein TNCT_218481 [Trichonephila clavata]|uniref:Uncharacterized protein n=1 Tax=Trichonephila clavata TaxID=2740835 RepID=A0A8X6IS20_TRICU|nr:hypothetical protein TNCT_218481 [Trichonephila clavata]